MPEREEFVHEDVNNPSYLNRHAKLMFEEGFSFSGFERDCLWIKEGRDYLDVAVVSGADDDNDGRALCVADFDDDGDPDMFVQNTQRDRHHLYRNDTGRRYDDPDGHRYLKVQVEATRGHWQAAGAVVRASFGSDRTLAKIVALGSGFVSQNARELVFGLCDADYAEVSVQWPGRRLESFGRIAAGQTVRLVEGTGMAEPVARKTFRFADPAPPGLRVRVGDALAEVPAEGVDGRAAPIPIEPGRRRIVNFWATWCAGCVAELPDLAALDARADLDVILVSMDSPEDRARAPQFLKSRGVDLETRFASEATFASVLDPEELPLPTSIIVSEKGVIEAIVQGPIEEWSGFQR